MGKFSRQKGDRRERELKNILERIGANVTRSGGSLGEWDLIAVDGSLISLIQVTSNAWKPPAVCQQLLDFNSPPSSIVAFVMVRFDDPKYAVDETTGKRHMKKPAAIRVLMATATDRKWKRMEMLENKFMAVQKELNRERRTNPQPGDTDADCG